MKALWNPWLGSSFGLGATAFPKVNLLEFVLGSGGGQTSPSPDTEDTIPARRMTPDVSITTLLSIRNVMALRVVKLL